VLALAGWWIAQRDEASNRQPTKVGQRASVNSSDLPPIPLPAAKTSSKGNLENAVQTGIR